MCEHNEAHIPFISTTNIDIRFNCYQKAVTNFEVVNKLLHIKLPKRGLKRTRCILAICIESNLK